MTHRWQRLALFTFLTAPMLMGASTKGDDADADADVKIVTECVLDDGQVYEARLFYTLCDDGLWMGPFETQDEANRAGQYCTDSAFTTIETC